MRMLEILPDAYAGRIRRTTWREKSTASVSSEATLLNRVPETQQQYEKPRKRINSHRMLPKTRSVAGLEESLTGKKAESHVENGLPNWNASTGRPPAEFLSVRNGCPTRMQKSCRLPEWSGARNR